MDSRIREFFKNTFIALLVVSLLCVIPYINYKELKKREKSPSKVNSYAELIYEFKPNKTSVEIFAETYNVPLEEVKVIEINKKYSYISTIIDDEIKSEIINNETDEVTKFESIVNEENEEALNSLIKEEVSKKYPEFIANALNMEETTKTYEFLDDGILISFSNYTTIPAFEEKTSVELTCKLVKDIIEYDCNESDEYNPNKYTIDPNKKTVAITFDDGPSQYTSEIIDILNANKAHATFFVVGTYTNIFTKSVQKIVDTNNEIGIHTYNHKNLIKLNDEELDFQLNTYAKNLSEQTKTPINLVRPPYGNINDKVKNNYNFSYILWSLDTEDWSSRDKEKIKENVLSKVKDGDIILLHDLYSTTKDSLQEILPELYVRGYQVVTVSKLAELKNTPLEPNKIYRKF